jgi:hypothetical protein
MSSPEVEIALDPRSLYISALARAFRSAVDTRAEALSRIGTLPRRPCWIHGSAAPEMVALPGGIDLVITSPPYFGMNDYVRSQYLTELIFPGSSYDQDLAVEIGSRRDRRQEMALREYLSNLEVVFTNVCKQMNPQGQVVVVMGESETKLAREEKVLSRVKDIITGAGAELVWERTRRVKFRKVNAVPYRNETLWIFQPGRGTGIDTQL